jgi:hypothetical protein
MSAKLDSAKAASCGPASRFILQRQKDLLTAKTDELAVLHFSILLTAKWEAAEGVSEERRAELRTELLNLRTDYFDKIDDIAMTFGVQKAIDAKKAAERTTRLPREIESATGLGEAERRCA